ncbi:MAG: beta-lactamase family protein [Candidatus Wildermuthbacteria bacterium]|nr:beta-lactamase family protein [Candidatus Wildermuthbacteria bacterium]
MKQGQKRKIASLSRFLDFWLPQRMNYEHVPGLSLGVVLDGELVLQRGYGFADVERKVRTKPETSYRVASISKMFTAVAILQLAEGKKLHLDDAIISYLPWFQVKCGRRSSKDITIRQALSHTSGMFRDGEHHQWVDDHFPNSAKLKELLSKETLTFDAHEQFKYSNFAFALLGEVIQAVSGMEYTKYIEHHIFRPLGMVASTADVQKSTRDLASGYGRFIPGIKKRAKFSRVKTNAFAAAAGVATNVKDLARFAVFLADERDSVGILGKKSKREMKRIQARTGDNRDRFYGLGIIISQKNSRTFYGHEGMFQGFSTHLLIDPVNRVSTIILTNSIEVFVSQIAFTIHNVFSHAMEDKQNKPDETENFRRFEGYYRGRWGDIAVVQFGEKLFAQGPFEDLEESPAMLAPLGRNEFRIEKTNKFDNIGERAVFVREKGKLVLWWGNSVSLYRIKQ